MNFPKLLKIFKTRKRQPNNSTSAANVPTASTQGPKPGSPTRAAFARAWGGRAKGKGLGLVNKNAGGINVSTASEVAQKSASWFSNLQSKIKNQQSSKALDEVVRFLGSYLHCS